VIVTRVKKRLSPPAPRKVYQRSEQINTVIVNDKIVERRRKVVENGVVIVDEKEP
jgi:hypothetical protein